jgi:hypothetical protein
MEAKSLLQYPQLLEEWSSSRNAGISPSQVSPGSNKKYWWECGLGHEWEARAYNRTKPRGTGCPYCLNQKVLAGYNDLATTHPTICSEFLTTKNVGIDPSQIIAGSEKRFWWICDLGHEWEASPASRTRLNSGCPVCAGVKVWSGFNDLASQHPKLAREWSDKNGIPADHQLAGGNKKAWWRCSNGHEWQTKINVRVKLGANCPVCSNQKVIPGLNDLSTIHPEIAAQWHPDKNGEIAPSSVSVGSAKSYWWKCNYGHEWRAALSSRRRNGCPVCGNRIVIAGENDLCTTNPEIAAQWHPEKNRDLQPSQVALGQTKSIWWRCSEGHEWKATLDTRSRSGCPRCAKYGFDQSEDAELYFIENTELHAWKIGITGSNRSYDRLAEFERKGWVVLHRFGPYEGWIVRAAERELFAWIRAELKLPQFLDAKTMGRQGGSTETFSLVYELKSLIVERIVVEITKAQGNQL